MTAPRDLERAARNLAAAHLAAVADELAAEARTITDRARHARAAGIAPDALDQPRHRVTALQHTESAIRRRAAGLAAPNTATDQPIPDTEPLFEVTT